MLPIEEALVTDVGGRIPLIGEEAPAFKAESTHGVIKFPDDYRGKWVILFSHPADFTPVCTTEFLALAALQPEFQSLGCELLGLSIDSLHAHIAWQRAIEEKIHFHGLDHIHVNFPIIADASMAVARLYGMIQPGASSTKAVRAVFYIDPHAKIRAILYYPLNNGRNSQEMKRLLIAMQTSDQHEVATPSDWQPGEAVILPPPTTADAAAQRLARPPAGAEVQDWFMAFKKI